MPTTHTKPGEKLGKVRSDMGFQVRSIDKQNRTATFIASTDATDSYGETINQQGWDLSRFLAHPVIPFGHDYWSLPVGKAIRTQIVDNKLEVDIEFATAEANPVAEQVWQCLVSGIPLAVSVGFMPIDWHYETLENGSTRRAYDRQELIEVSIVTVPSNPEALQKSIVDGLRSTKAERRAPAMRALELLTTLLSVKSAELEEETEEEEVEETEIVEEETGTEDETRAILKAYRKLVPSLRVLLNVDTKENEGEQVEAIREALVKREAEPVAEEEVVADAETPAGEAAETAETVAEETDPEPGAETPAEPELDSEDIASIAEATAELLSAESNN